MPTAPSTIFCRAAMTAPACWRCSIACGDLRRVREVADPRLDHLDAGLRQPVLDLLLQMLGNFRGVAAQRHLASSCGVVGVARRQVAQRRFALHVDEVVVVVDLEDGLGRVDDPPDHHRGDLDRVALVVVDLQACRSRSCAPAARCASWCRTGWPSGVRAPSPCPCSRRRAGAPPLVRVDHEQASHQEDPKHHRERETDDLRGRVRRCALHQAVHARRHDDDQDEEYR